MPTSSPNGKAHIRRIVGALKHDRMLDIGCGEGTYAKLFPDADWTGIEVWEPYVEAYGLRSLYPTLIVADARTHTFAPDEHFDVAFAGDVLEHMTEDEAAALLEKLKACAGTVIASIPIGHYPQGEWGGNPYERHVVDDWTDERVKTALGEPSWSAVDGEIGVYVWSTVENLCDNLYKRGQPLKIAVYAISKNEEQFVERFCNSAKEADYVVIADTGSTDGTVDAARRHNAVVHSICISPWRFDTARNAALALIPGDADVCISLDLDEVLEPGWREEIERVWKDDTTRLRYFFDWGCGIKFKYEKIHHRKGYLWHHPCHEYPVPEGRTKEVWADTDMLLVSHHPDPTKSRGQYLDLLELSVKEDPACPRNAFYYARELSFHRRWSDASAACERYLKLPAATWHNERCYAYRVMGKCYEELGRPWDAEAAYHRACAEAPNTREPWCAMALLTYRQGRWAESYAAAMRALAIRDRDMVYTCDPEVWGAQPHDLASIAAWHLGLREVAAEQAQLAVAHNPGDARLQKNLEIISQPIETAA
jgi:glycosyltransferase involved in cell wall biosynthesis